MNKSCEKCAGKCCYGPRGWVELYARCEVPPEMTERIKDGKTEYTAMKMVKVEGSKHLRCIALVDGKCSIYKNRPFVCRTYHVGSPPCRAQRKPPIPS